MTLFEAQAIGLTWGAAAGPVFSDLSFSIGPGENWRLTGPSGCGKTSLMRVIAGLTEPSSGRVARRFSRPAMCFAEPRLIPHLSVLGNLRFVRRALTEREVARLLASVGMEAQTRVRANTLSKGQSQRVALLRALIVAPDILFLDEALGGLDNESFAKVRALVGDHRRRDPMAVIEISHDKSRYVAVDCSGDPSRYLAGRGAETLCVRCSGRPAKTHSNR